MNEYYLYRPFLDKPIAIFKYISDEGFDEGDLLIRVEAIKSYYFTDVYHSYSPGQVVVRPKNCLIKLDTKIANLLL